MDERQTKRASIVSESLIGGAIGALCGLLVGLAFQWRAVADALASPAIFAIVLGAAIAAAITIAGVEALARTRRRKDEQARRAIYVDALRDVAAALDEFDSAPELKKRTAFEACTRSIADLESHRTYARPRTAEENSAILRVGQAWRPSIDAAKMGDDTLSDRERFIGNNALRESLVVMRSQIVRSLAAFQR